MSADDFVLAVLNTTPTLAGRRQDQLTGAAGGTFLTTWGHDDEAGLGTLAAARDAVQDVIVSGSPSSALEHILDQIVQRPRLTAGGLVWDVDTPPDLQLATTFLMAWTETSRRLPGRLRRCANDECSLFLLDRSKGRTGRWCSMATCGNRMKARRHHERART